MKVVLIDANALIHRVYHALPRLSDSLGRPTNALYGLSNILLKFLKENKPDYLFALYDRPEPTIRHQVFKEYKAQRPALADDLKIQIGLSKKIFQAFGVVILEKAGYEADDLIATLKNHFKDKASEIIILTGDLDTLQLVDEKTKVLTMKKGISEIEIYTSLKVKQKYGIEPWQIPDFKTLIGDKSDNIPGVKGIGEKTASLLLQKFGTLEGIIQASKEGKLDPSYKKIFLNEEERLLFFKSLLTLRGDVPLEVNLDEMKYQGYDIQNLKNVFSEFSFRSLLKRLEEERPVSNLFTKISPPAFRSQKEVKTGVIENLKSPFYLRVNESEIEVYDGELWKFKIDDLEKLLLTPHQKIVYDFKNLIKNLLHKDFYFDRKIDLNKIFDVKLAFWLLNPDKGNFSLEEILNYFRLEGDFYNGMLNLEQILKNRLKEENLENIYFLELKVSPILARMEKKGIRIDEKSLENFKEFLKKLLAQNLEEIYKLAGRRFNVNSPYELNVILFKDLKIPTKGLTKTKSGLYSTKESDLLKIQNQHPIINKILDYRKNYKLFSSYSEAFLKFIDFKTKRIYTTFSQTTASTGRIISEKPNLQNLPLRGELAKEFRKIFISDEGFVFISADYSQIELRILAHLSQDPTLIKAFKEDWDLHSEVAKYVFGKVGEEERRKAKIINFGIVYGITPRGLAERLNLSLSEAKKIMERFYAFFPQVKIYQEKTIKSAYEKMAVETLLGRKKPLPEIRTLSYRERGEAERMALNYPIQALGADIIKKGMIEIEEQILQRNWQDSAYLVLQIHDELIFEVKEEIKEEFKVIIKNVLENVIFLDVPLKVNLSEGKNLAELIK